MSLFILTYLYFIEVKVVYISRLSAILLNTKKAISFKNTKNDVFGNYRV